MAVRATFNADFSGFLEAVGKAEKKLVDLNTGADKVGKTLDRMAVEFSGRRIIQEALLIEKAIEQIGGTSKLTQKELERVGAKASEAIAKMKALGYEVPQGLQNIATAAGKTTTQMGSMLGTVTKLAGAFGIAFGAQAVLRGVINLGRELFQTADELTKLHDKTGISVEALQRFRAAGDNAGNTLEQLTGSITQMQNRLASGDTSAVAALGKLNLNLDDLKRLQPEQQFIEIGRAIKGVQDPAEQVALAMDLFGRSGAEILPTIKGGFDDLADSAGVMSAEAIKALDDVGDAITRLWRSVKAAIGKAVAAVIAPTGPVAEQMANLRRAVAAAGGAETLSPEQAAQLRAPTGVFPVMPLPQPIEQANAALRAQAQIESQLTRQIKEKTDATKKDADAAKNAAEKLAEWAKQQDNLKRSMRDATIESNNFYEAGFGWLFGKGIKGDIGSVTRLPEDFRLIATNAGLASKNLITMNRALVDGSEQWLPRMKQTKTVTEQLHTAFGNVSTILDNIPGKFAEIGSVATRTADAILSSWGNWTQVAVAGVTGLIQILSRIGGPNEQQREARQNQANFLKELEKIATAQQKLEVAAVRGSRAYATFAIVGRDAMLAIGKSAAEAERVVKGLLDTENPENFARAMQDVQDALDLQEEAWDTLEQTLGRYKFSIEELGPALQSQQLSKQAQQLFKDWQILSAAGVNLAAIGREMSESVNDFVRNAIRFRTEVDPAMRPMLQSFVDMGLLTDANGEVIKDLEGAGVHFAKTMSQEFDRLIAKVNDLIQVIAVGLGVAIDTTVDKLGGLRVPGMPTGPTTGPNPPAAPQPYAPPTSGNGNGGSAAYDLHTHLYLDGRQIAEQVTRVQTDDFLLRNKTRAA